MTDHTNTYPDLVNVEDWLNAKGYTGEAGACHAAMSLIRKQETRIAELEKMLAVHRLAVDVDALKARIAELTAALKLLLDAVDEKSADERETLAEFENFAAVVRAARAAYPGEKDD
jgi:succinate dehydrogenase/fumarate reductase-like Fe-S protein